jgi:putative hemolysin
MLPIRKPGRLQVELAAGPADIRAAQALRYQIFAGEMGACVKGENQGLDTDEFDPYCQHLLVRESASERVVGCTRLLTRESAERLGCFYAEREFEIGAIRDLPGRILEVGRTCIAPEYRQGAGIAVLWSGLAGFIHLQGIDYLFGCASMPLGENDMQAAAMMNRVRRVAMAPTELMVRPRFPLLAPSAPDEVLDSPLPPLLKAYMRLGAKACGEPCRDPDFGVADVLMLLEIEDLNPTYSRHFMERAARD